MSDRYQKAGIPDGDIPETLKCPIMLCVMDDPVVAADGVTYERACVEDWLAKGKTTSPLHGSPLEHTYLVPNQAVKTQIIELLEARGGGAGSQGLTSRS